MAKFVLAEGDIVTWFFDKDFLVTDFRGLRVHQVRLQGGDASSDSYCFS